MFVNARARVYRVPDARLNKKAKMSEKVANAEAQGQAQMPLCSHWCGSRSQSKPPVTHVNVCSVWEEHA